MGVRNGAKFLREQINSILPQLAVDDELIVSDDGSTDESLDILHSYQDARIRVIHGNRGVARNFESALSQARGTYIFLADQDDVWAPNKVKVTLDYLSEYDMVVSDCVLVDAFLTPQYPSFQKQHGSRRGLLWNLYRNSYMGCCMAFHSKILRHALPFPSRLPVHDAWIGLVGELYYKSIFIEERLLLHRRHHQNASTTGTSTRRSWSERLKDRWILARNVMELKYAR